MNIAEEIKSRLTMADVLQFYINYSGRKNRLPCPLHNGKNPNFAFNENHFICFKCGEKGDVITFAMLYFGLDFMSAMNKLNDDFSLGIIKARKEITRRDMLKSIKAKQDREAKRKAYETEQKRLEDNYWKAFDEWKKYDDNKRKYRPKEMSEQFHPLFVEALKNINYAEYKLEVADIERTEFEKCRKI